MAQRYPNKTLLLAIKLTMSVLNIQGFAIRLFLVMLFFSWGRTCPLESEGVLPRTLDSRSGVPIK